MKYSMKIRLVLMVLLFLAACNSLPKETILPQPVLTKQVDTPTATATPKTTFTAQPTRTHTPIPIATFTPWPTKEVLLQFGVFGGDGGRDYYAFIGGGMPELILYTDGQLIAKQTDGHGTWFEETRLTVSQMCSFLAQIEKAGFFTLAVNNSFEPAYPTDNPNPIYDFDNTVQLSEGGSDYVMQVNGPKHRQIVVYSHYVQYLIPEAKRVFNLFNNYSPPSKLTDYQAQYMLLIIEKGLGNSIYLTPAPVTQTWPTDLPPLAILEKENVDTEISPYLESQISQVLMAGEQIMSIVEAFDNRLAYKPFQSGDGMYYVAARPFLPHETLSNFSESPREQEFDLPFRCSE